MTTYIVTSRETGVEIYRYSHDVPVEWNGMEFATHDHTPMVDVAPDGAIIGQSARILSKLEYLRRFTQAERIAIRQAAKQSEVLEDYLRLLELAEEINTGDPDTTAAVQMLEAAGLLASGRAAEVLS